MGSVLKVLSRFHIFEISGISKSRTHFSFFPSLSPCHFKNEKRIRRNQNAIRMQQPKPIPGFLCRFPLFLTRADRPGSGRPVFLGANIGALLDNQMIRGRKGSTSPWQSSFEPGGRPSSLQVQAAPTRPKRPPSTAQALDPWARGQCRIRNIMMSCNDVSGLTHIAHTNSLISLDRD